MLFTIKISSYWSDWIVVISLAITKDNKIWIKQGKELLARIKFGEKNWGTGYKKLTFIPDNDYHLVLCPV